jgi:3-methyladenine DNA glycosylase/8-oxoguanine DNA glycosylase
LEDLGLQRAAGNGAQLTCAQLRVLAERWRPWRALAAAHLWMTREAAITPAG